MLDIPKLLREVDIVVVRILKSRDLVPKGVYLLAAVALDLLDIPLLIDAFALAEEWLKQLAGGVIRQSFALPCEIGVKKLIGAGVVDGGKPSCCRGSLSSEHSRSA